MEQTFLLFVKDRRFAMPVLVTLEDADLDDAKLAASEHLGASEFHDFVEVVDSEQNAIVVTRDSVHMRAAA